MCKNEQQQKNLHLVFKGLKRLVAIETDALVELPLHQWLKRQITDRKSGENSQKTTNRSCQAASERSRPLSVCQNWPETFFSRSGTCQTPEHLPHPVRDFHNKSLSKSAAALRCSHYASDVQPHTGELEMIRLKSQKIQHLFNYCALGGLHFWGNCSSLEYFHCVLFNTSTALHFRGKYSKFDLISMVNILIIILIVMLIYRALSKTLVTLCFTEGSKLK